MTDERPQRDTQTKGWFSRLLHRRVFQTLAIYVAIAWGGTEILLAVQETLGFPEWIARLAIAAFIAGLPMVAFLAWAHDLESRTAGILLRGTAVAILVAGVVLVFQQSRPAGPPHASVAVLPFIDMSPDAGQGLLIGALAEDLRNTLAQADGLLVIATNSSEVFRGRGGDLDQIREKLNVRHVLDGSVRDEGERLRITANLVDTVTGRHIWSDRYDLPAENVFEVEDRLVDRITGSLSVTLAPEVKQGGTRSLAAYEAYQRGRESDSEETRFFNYQEALRVDPSFAWPLIEMAAYYASQAEDQYITPQAAWEKAAPLLERASRINDRIPAIYFVYGVLNTYLDDYAEAESNYQRAIELNPNYAPAYGAYGLLMRWALERYEDAVTLHERNVQVDPLDYLANVQLGTSYWFVNRLQDARNQYEKAIRICPHCDTAYHSYSGMLWRALGRIDQALDVMYRMFANVGEPTPRVLVQAWDQHSILGDKIAAARYGAAIEAAAPNGPPAIEIRAERYLEAGRLEEARALAESLLQSQPRDGWARSFLGWDGLEGRRPAEGGWALPGAPAGSVRESTETRDMGPPGNRRPLSIPGRCGGHGTDRQHHGGRGTGGMAASVRSVQPAVRRPTRRGDPRLPESVSRRCH